MNPLFRLPGPARGEIVAFVDVPVENGARLRGCIIHKDSAGGLRVAPPSIISWDPSGQPELQEAFAFESEDTRRQWEQRILDQYRAWVAKSPSPQSPGPVRIKITSQPTPPRGATEGPVVLDSPVLPPPAPVQSKPGRWLAYFDGGSRGNPGPSACGVVVQPPEGPVVERARYLGETTNNVAEYNGVVLALETISELAGDHTPVDVLIRGDSQLAVRQLSGEWKIKDARLAGLAERVHDLVDAVGAPVRFQHVMREQNKKADQVVNRCLDEAERAEPEEPDEA